MWAGLLSVVGGLGLFLLGMAIMTDGLKNIAGGFLRSALSRFTQNPVKGAVTGMVGTALVQSSSATTVMAVGFVGAGLLTFPQALGVIFGANIGTTITGWLVALLGFKLSLGQIVLPLVFVGALMRLFGGKRVSACGVAIAGFALVFIGIAELQQGMDVFKDDVTPESFPSNTWFGRFLLVLIGIVITLVTQSSSAGVATAITAVHVGNITLAQAAAMVIGMDVGTTVTAAMAVIGGSTDAKRTGLAHVIYNLMTGVAAFLLLPLYIWSWESLAPQAAVSNAEIALVMFHTVFNTLGVLAVLPLTYRFADLIKWLIPEKGNELISRLDSSLFKEPGVAVENVKATLFDVVNRFLPVARELIAGRVNLSDVESILDDVDEAIEQARLFMQRVDTSQLDESTQNMGLASLHVLDHLSRLSSRCRNEEIMEISRRIEDLNALRYSWLRSVEDGFLLPERIELAENGLKQVWDKVDELSQKYRPQVMRQAVTRDLTIEESLLLMDAFRWFRRICHHTWRIVYHLRPENLSPSPAEIEPESEI